MRYAVERFLLPVTTLHSLAFAVAVITVRLIIVVYWAFPVVVRLISVSIAVSLHGRGRLWLLELGKNGAKVDVGSWLRWIVVCWAILIRLADCCQCRVQVKAASSWRLRHWLRRLHLSGLLLRIGELGEDRFQTIGLTRLLLCLWLWSLVSLRAEKLEQVGYVRSWGSSWRLALLPVRCCVVL